MPANPVFRKQTIDQVRATLGLKHYFSSKDDRAIEIIAFNDFMQQIDSMSIALRILLGFIGALTLGIGGVGLDQHHAGLCHTAHARDWSVEIAGRDTVPRCCSSSSPKPWRS